MEQKISVNGWGGGGGNENIPRRIFFLIRQKRNKKGARKAIAPLLSG